MKELLEQIEEVISTHYLTQRQTQSRHECCVRWIFQLTTSRRGRPYIIGEGLTDAAFQLTTSRKGRRCRISIKCYGSSISTHYLTQRQTRFWWSVPLFLKISTHYLTQRQTDVRIVQMQFACSFQLTTSRKGRLTGAQSTKTISHFNSLPHAKVDGQRGKGKFTVLTFQLTTSRKGRRTPANPPC